MALLLPLSSAAPSIDGKLDMSLPGQVASEVVALYSLLARLRANQSRP